MKIFYHNLLCIIIFVVGAEVCYSQDYQLIQLGADVMSRNIWRGVNLGGNSPSIQPSLKLNLVTDDTSHVLTIGTWGAFSMSELEFQEADLYVTYTFKKLIGLTVTDYFFPSDLVSARNNYFNYDSETTGHVFEGMLTFNGTKHIPFTLVFAMNFYGADRRKMNEDGTSGDIFFSKYAELGYHTSLKGVDINAFIGAALDNPDEDKGEQGYYYNLSAGIINLGVKASKKIPVTEKYQLPVQASLIFNPEAENIFIVFGISF
jgi:hypothetical protein